MDTLANTPTEYFSPQQKAEVASMRGELQWKTGHLEEAHRSFSESVQTFENSSSAWLIWGKFCDEQFMESKDLTWADHSISCYLQALRGGNDKAR